MCFLQNLKNRFHGIPYCGHTFNTMDSVISSLGQELYQHGKHKVFLGKWNLISPLCKKWSRNRDPDQGRVSEMLDYLKHGGYIPRMIHLAHVADEGLVCYDGNHRREVFNVAPLGGDMICLFDVLFDACQNDVYMAFNDINKSVQVPAMFFYDEHDKSCNGREIKDDILALVKTYETKYKAFVSTSPRYHAPNFNRDCFIDNVYNIYKHFNGSLSIADIGNALDKLNEDYAKGIRCRPHSSYKITIIEKCKKGNLWLFIDKVVPFEHVQQVLSDSGQHRL